MNRMHKKADTSMMMIIVYAVLAMLVLLIGIAMLGGFGEVKKLPEKLGINYLLGIKTADDADIQEFKSTLDYYAALDKTDNIEIKKKLGDLQEDELQPDSGEYRVVVSNVGYNPKCIHAETETLSSGKVITLSKC